MLEVIEQNIIILLQKFNSLKFLKYFTRAFDYDFLVIILITLYLIGCINKFDFYLMIIGIIVIFLIKSRHQRSRPFKSNKFIKKLSSKSYDEGSFPSGHTFISELLILILIENHNIKGTQSQFLHLISYLVAFSRVYLGDHYLTDVIFSIIFANIYNIIFGGFFRLLFSQVS